MAVRLYKHLQDTLETENQYQALLETSGVFVALLSNDLSKMDYYTPTDADYSCRQRILTKIMAKYYNYNLFTDLTEYFGNRLLWRLNQIMPTYKAKFNAMLSQSGYEDLWDDGVMTESRSGHRYTDIDPTDSYDKTILNDTTTSIDYQSDYPQVITGSAEVTVSGQTYTVNTDFNELGNKNKTTRGGDDKVEHSLDEDVNYGEDLTRKFTPEEIAKAKLLFAQLIFNIDEEIVRAVADLFILVDCPFEEDFDVGARMSMLADAKAYTNLKFAEAEAYTDQEVAKAKEIVYIPIADADYSAVSGAVNNNKLPIIIDGDGKRWYFEQVLTGDYTFTNGIDWMILDYQGQWSTGKYINRELYKCTYNQTTFAQITQALAEDKIPYVIFTTGEYFFFYKNIDNLKYRFTESYIRETGITYFIDVDTSNTWGIVPVSLEVTSNKATAISASSTNTQYSSAKAVYDYVYGVEQSIYQGIGNAYQTLNNLVTSWGSPTSDSKYPSEKLVKDTIDANTKLVEVTYNSTPYTTMMAYVGNDKIPYFIRTVDSQPFVYIYQGNTGGDVMVFTCNFHNGIYYQQKHITVTYNSGGTDTWDEYSQDLQERLVTFGADQNIKAIDSASVTQGSILGTGTLDLRDLVPIYYGGNNDPTNTKYTDITAIINNGQIPYINYNGYNYLMTYSTGSSYVFTAVSSTTGIRRITVTDADAWTSGSGSIQLASYLVTTWQATPDNTHYPSEKLVKDSIDAIPKLYECTFDSSGNGTTQTEIAQALNDGKIPYVVVSDFYYFYTSYSSSRYYFSCPSSATLRRVYCPSNNRWGTANQNLENTGNKVTSWQATPDDTHYPSEKLVKDSIDAVIAGQTYATFLIDLSQQIYSSGGWQISGIDLTSYSSFTFLPYEGEAPQWNNFMSAGLFIDISSITASGFYMYGSNAFTGKLRIVAYI